MPTISRLIPPPDLLKRVAGVERGLRSGKRAQDVGAVGLIVAVIQLAAVVVTSKWWGGLSSSGWIGALSAVGVLLLLLSILLLNWTRIWVRESRQPFRYTYSIDSFEPVKGTEEEPRLAWLREDLSRRLSQRIRRLSLLDPRYSGAVKAGDSHIHIGGSYGIRRSSKGTCAIEVIPWIRLGPEGEPAKIAHPVTFALPKGEEELRGTDGATAYEKLVERIYFSIASRLYAQIRQDVQHKVDLLPRRYYRAAAYFYEAEDYVSSNTLDAYDAAKEMYEAVIVLYDPLWLQTAKARPARGLQKLDALLARWALLWRRYASEVWPGLGRIELMICRAHVGYAKTLLYRRALAGFSGQRLNPVFETRPVAQAARARIDNLPVDVPGRRDVLFEALVVEAYAYALLGPLTEAEQLLERARSMDPARAEQDPLYLFVKSQTAERPTPYLQRAVDLAPSFEVAQYERALDGEMIWRRRPTLEHDVARNVFEAYERVLTLNPANISAWANLGYMHWLLGDEAAHGGEHMDEARAALERGREYKEISPETFVAELDYGLARIAAENGKFADAYKHYINAVAAQTGEGVSHARSFTSYHFDRINDAVLQRFERYARAVEKEWTRTKGEGSETPQRIRDSVYAFVLNDYGEACVNYWLRTGSTAHLELAREHLLNARDTLLARYPMIAYNLARLTRWGVRGDLADLRDEDILAEPPFEASGLLDTQHVEALARYEPDWPDGMLEQALSYSVVAQQARTLTRRLRALAAEHEESADRLDAEAAERSSAESPWDYVFRGTQELSTFQQEAVSVAQRPTGPTYGADPTAQTPSNRLPTPWIIPMNIGSGASPSPEPASTDDDPGELRRVASRLLERASDLDKCAEHNEARATRLARRLLPHDWLWQESGDLDPGIFERLDYLRERRWERELDDLHFEAMVEWCRPRASAEEREPNATPLRLLTRLRDLRGGDWGLLDLCRTSNALPEKERIECSKRLAEMTRHTAAQYSSFNELSWVLPDELEDSPALFESGEESNLLIEAAVGRDLPPRLCLWLGDMLTARDDSSAARDAYENGLSSDDPDVLLELGGRLEGAGQLSLALRAYTLARARDDGADRKNHPDRYRLALGFVQWKLGQEAEAMAELDAIGPASDAVPEYWRTDLAQQLIAAESVEWEDSYRVLKRWLGRDLTAAQGTNDAVTRRDASRALLVLTASRYRPLIRRGRDDALSAAIDEMIPLVRPVTLEADASLFEDGEQTPEVTRMLETEIPDLLADVHRRTGVVIRGIRTAQGEEIPSILIVPSQSVGSGRYRIYLQELPVAEGDFESTDEVFVLDATEDSSGSPGVDPLSGRAGRWLSEPQKTNGDSLSWDRYTHMLRHVHAVLVENAHRFVDFRQLDFLGGPSSEHEQIRLVGILRALSAEGIPLRQSSLPGPDLLSRTTEDLPSLVESARFRMRDALPSADASVVLTQLGAELEDRIEAGRRLSGGKAFLALSADVREELRDAVRERVGDGRDVAIVVLKPGLRPFVRRIVEVADPRIAVVARREVPAARLPATVPTAGPTGAQVAP